MEIALRRWCQKYYGFHIRQLPERGEGIAVRDNYCEMTLPQCDEFGIPDFEVLITKWVRDFREKAGSMSASDTFEGVDFPHLGWTVRPISQAKTVIMRLEAPDVLSMKWATTRMGLMGPQNIRH